MTGLPASAQLRRAVTDDERERFAADGVVLLEAIYPDEWVEHLRTQLHDVFDHQADRDAFRGSIEDGTSERGAINDMVAILQTAQAASTDADLAIEGGRDAVLDGRSIVETDASAWHAGMRAHNHHGPIGRLAHELTGSDEVVFYSDQLFHKGPGSRVKTPWHQDKPYFLVDGGDVAVAWVPVDTVRKENGAMGYVRGSHRWGTTFKPSDFVTDTGVFPEQNGIDHSDLEALDHALIREEDVIHFDAGPGDVIVHHWATLHGSTGNTSPTAGRSAASIRLALDGCHFHRRPSSPEPFRFTLDLADGDPLTDADRFVRVWPKGQAGAAGS